MKAIILLSGGIDSTVVLALALSEKRDCVALSFDYGQKHRIELQSANKIASYYGIPHKTITIDPNTFACSSLVTDEKVPCNRTLDEMENDGIPSTYVPARNTIFLAYALAQCEIHLASEVHFGPNIYDRNPYPDCRPEYIDAYQNLYELATKQSIENKAPQIITPLINLNKYEIVKLGIKLNAPLNLTHSCYSPKPDNSPCEICDACILRGQAFCPKS